MTSWDLGLTSSECVWGSSAPWTSVLLTRKAGASVVGLSCVSPEAQQCPMRCHCADHT